MSSFDLSKIKSLAQWRAIQPELQQAVRECLGPMADPPRSLPYRVVSEDDLPSNVRRQQIAFILPSEETAIGWLFLPEGKKDLPAVLCCHDWVPQGKDEPAGIDARRYLDLALHYARNGYVTLAVDTVCAGDRQICREGGWNEQAFTQAAPGHTLAGKMLEDHRAALSLLAECGAVDAGRIGVVGHGLGGFNALMLAAFDERVQVCAASCGFTRFETDKIPGFWPSNPPVPLWPVCRADGSLPAFDWEHILALAAPTATLAITPNAVHANPKSCQKAVRLADRIYKLLGAQGALDQYWYATREPFTHESREAADDWLERWL